MSILAELKRRNVIRVLIAYLAAAWFLFTNLRDDPRWDAFWDEHWYTEEEFAAVELNIP